MNIMICDPISPKGIALFQQCTQFQVTVLKQRLPEAELLPLVKDVDAMIVRSETKITRAVIDAAPKLRVVGRELRGVLVAAGVGDGEELVAEGLAEARHPKRLNIGV